MYPFYNPATLPNAEPVPPPAIPKDHRMPPPRPVTWEWGDEYPCETYLFTDAHSVPQCGGWMQPGARFAHEGRYWRHFKCKTCGRSTTDLVSKPRDMVQKGAQ